MIKERTSKKTVCYHCGQPCDDVVRADNKEFCCEGCKQVYLLLSETGLCNYYDLEKNPGIKAKGKFTDKRFAYLDNEELISKLLRFKDSLQAHVQFYLPTMHCASCIWLLENLHKINPAIISSSTNFQRKEVFIVFQHQLISLKQVVELLAYVGYEPYISLNDNEVKKEKKINRSHIYKIGIAGFCFSNIMMLSFPEYFSSGNIGLQSLRQVFSYLILFLSLPVLFYSASEFFISGWKGLRQGWLNIDAPIALAIMISFGRSVYEILTHSGPGYLDSMSGIVFFMLLGRWFQNRTYDAFSFDRDYTSYFPLGVTVIGEEKEKNIPLAKLKKGDHIRVRQEEMIPADGLLISGEGFIDYSFVSGETTPVEKRKGDLIYAGGKQAGTAIDMEVVTPVSQSYITQLWNNDVFQNSKHKEQSFIHPWSRYFTYILLAIALLTGIYWSIQDSSKLWPAVTAVLIVACPCSLLLSSTFTYGNMLSILGKNKFYLKNAGVIESLDKIDTVVMDKTGTLTHHNSATAEYHGKPLSDSDKQLIKEITSQSTHPLSKIISHSLQNQKSGSLQINDFKEIVGNGLIATVNNQSVKIGSPAFVDDRNSNADHSFTRKDGATVYISFNDVTIGHFLVSNEYREGTKQLAQDLENAEYNMVVLSGDNDREKNKLQRLFGPSAAFYFNKSPQEKLDYIRQLQVEGKTVLMLGDGLNDAGALRQAEVGIAVSDNANLFSPASDAILDGNQVHKLGNIMRFSRTGKNIVAASFVLSILYNVVGLSFATRGLLTPMIAAILMPASSISIVLFVSLYAKISARINGLA